MPSRRTVIGAGTVLISPLGGCLELLEETPAVLKVDADLRNMVDDPRTFHITLETEDGVIEWDSYPVDGGTNETVRIEPPKDAFPVAFHAAVNEFADSLELMGLTNVDDDFCLHVGVRYGGSSDSTELLQYTDIDC